MGVVSIDQSIPTGEKSTYTHSKQTEGNLLRERHYELRLDLLHSSSNNKPSSSSSNGNKDTAAGSGPLSFTAGSGRSGGMGLAFIKRMLGPLDEGVALGAQIQVISLGAGVLLGGDGSGPATPEASAHALFALLQQYTRYSFAPLVKALATEATTSAKTGPASSNPADGEDGGPEEGGKEEGSGGKKKAAALSGASSASLLALQKKITELELALAQVCRFLVVYNWVEWGMWDVCVSCQPASCLLVF